MKYQGDKPRGYCNECHRSRLLYEKWANDHKEYRCVVCNGKNVTLDKTQIKDDDQWRK